MIGGRRPAATVPLGIHAATGPASTAPMTYGRRGTRSDPATRLLDGERRRASGRARCVALAWVTCAYVIPAATVPTVCLSPQSSGRTERID